MKTTFVWQVLFFSKVIFDTLSLVVTLYHHPHNLTLILKISETKLFLMKIDDYVDVDDIDVMFMLC